jgi:hypothetical protein
MLDDSQLKPLDPVSCFCDRFQSKGSPAMAAGCQLLMVKQMKTQNRAFLDGAGAPKPWLAVGKRPSKVFPS